jgi:hypothetical protein
MKIYAGCKGHDYESFILGHLNKYSLLQMCNKQSESLPIDISMFTVPCTSPAYVRYLLAADLRKKGYEV